MVIENVIPFNKEPEVKAFPLTENSYVVYTGDIGYSSLRLMTDDKTEYVVGIVWQTDSKKPSNEQFREIINTLQEGIEIPQVTSD